MATRYTPSRKTIGELLSLTYPPIVVPEWQRSYSWTTSEVETFWLDLQRFDAQYPGGNVDSEEYFLGSIVLVDSGPSHLLLDGQQRLATSAILFSVIRDYLAQFKQDSATRITTRYLTDYDDASEEVKYKLTLNAYDRDFFREEVLVTRDKGYTPPDPVRTSHHLIRKARGYFLEQFEKAYKNAETPKDAFRWSQRVLKLLTMHVSVVSVTSEDEDNAATVFETLNDRGIGLSTPDLLRNLLLRRAKASERDQIVSLWGEILDIGNDAKMRAFLRHYWVSHEGDVKTQSLYREIKANLLTRDTDSLEFSKQLARAATTYRDLLRAQHDNEDVARLLYDCNMLGAKVLYPVLLVAFEVIDDASELSQLLHALIVTFVRHNAVGQLENSRLEAFAFDIARRLREGIDVATAVQSAVAFAPSDEKFEADFSAVAVARQATARYLLKELENDRRRTTELDVASPAKVHVEHIYPRSPLPDDWWPDHDRIVHRIGNLTLLCARLNTSIRNATFDLKKPAFKESELLLTQNLADLDEWTPKIIDARQKQLAARACSIWSF